MSLNQLTIRGLDKVLERRIRQEAAASRTSLNKAALTLLKKGAGLSGKGAARDRVGSSLDHIIGSMTSAEAEKLRRELEAGRKIDEELWK